MKKLFSMVLVAVLFWAVQASANALPDPIKDIALVPTASPKPSASIVVAGGCFWGVQGVFQHVKGVTSAISGYAGGREATAHYQTVSTGTTGHAESVQVTYDPSQITLGQILKIYFAVAHNPTELNMQGPDHGTQYRSAIFYSTPEQKDIADAYIAQLGKAKAFSAPIVTTLEPLQAFYPAEDYHQDYMRLNPFSPYILANDRPKVKALEKEFSGIYIEPKR